MTDWTSAKGAVLYRKAKKLFPGGTQLLSKRPEMFLPEQWPSYYSRARGCEVWDLDNRRFIDVTNMSVGACLLGYADPDVDAAVGEVIARGSISTLNSPLEVDLAEVLLALHPWAEMVRFARTGGESVAVAVRIARACTGRDRVLFCGYHGWSDWYLAANLGEDNALDGLLLPGLEPRGVPRALRGTALTFRNNQTDQLEEQARLHGEEIAAIVMEPLRHEWPAPGFLEKVRATADRIGAVLVFDEISSGWGFHHGGAHRRLGVDPDMAVFAKAMSNGYPMGAVIGRRAVMEAAQTSFISSTYWTEGVGLAATLACLRKQKETGVAEHAERIGTMIQDGWRRLGERHGLKLRVAGLPALSRFEFEYGPRSLALRTLMTQDMLDRGYLAISGVYPCLAHTPEIVTGYLEALDQTFAMLREAVDTDTIDQRLRGPVAQLGFQRLN